MTADKRSEVVDALAEFVIRVSQDSARNATTAAEVSVLPAVAALVLDWPREALNLAL